MGNDVIRFAALGAGAYALKLMRMATSDAGVQAAAFCDVSEARAKAAAAAYDGAKYYTDFDTMLDTEKINALIISVPPFAHNGQELRATERGIHLFVSKPVGLDLNYARNVCTAIDMTGVVATVTYMIRHASPVEKIRKLLHKRSVALAQGFLMTRMIEGDRPWFFRKEQSGGQMVAQAGHVLDALRYVVGEVKEVCAMGATTIMPRSKAYDIEDASIAVLRFANGAIGQMAATPVMPAGARKTMDLDILASDLHLQYSFKRGILSITDNDGKREWHEKMDGLDAQQAQMTAFIEAIRTGNRDLVRSSYAEATKTLQLALAIDKAITTGKPVTVGDL